jgi:hypothetical protein
MKLKKKFNIKKSKLGHFIKRVLTLAYFDFSCFLREAFPAF